MGILRNYEIQSTKATCVLNDHTGEIKAVMWLEADGVSINFLFLINFYFLYLGNIFGTDLCKSLIDLMRLLVYNLVAKYRKF